MFTYILIGLCVLEVHTKRRSANRELAKKNLPFTIEDDRRENVYVFAFWPLVLIMWCF